MKLSSRLFATIAFSFFIGSTIAQDLIYTISGELDSNKIALDSILFENLTNGKKLLFENLPDQNDYVINLTTQEQQGPTGIRNLTHENY